jgi:hypothetical protein
MQSDSPSYLKGAVFSLAAVSIWAGWSAMTRLAVTTNLDAWDIPTLRFGVAGLLLSPILIRRGLARERLGWLELAGIIVGQGAPYVLVAALGLRFAPAADLGALSPGCMPLFVALIAATIVGEKPSTTQNYGLSLILVGALIMIGWHGSAWSASRTFGDAAFLMAGFLTACFTVIMREAKLDPIHAAALVSTGSLIIYAPIYLALHGTPTRPDAARRCGRSGIFSRRGGQHRCSRPVWPCSCDFGRFGRLGIWRVGASVVSAVRHTAGWRMAKQNRLARHRTNLRWRISGKRRTNIGLEPARGSSRLKRSCLNSKSRAWQPVLNSAWTARWRDDVR